MRTTLILPDGLLEKVQRLSREKSKTRAVVAAMESYVKIKGRQELLALRGRIPIDYDWEQEEAAELALQRERERMLEIGRTR
jgi:Arc/MetJ family transcription regulator